MKIINILPTHPPRGFFSNVTEDNPPLGLSSIDFENSDRIKKYPYWIIYDYTDGFHSRMAQSLLKLDPSLEIECWSLYEDIEEVFEKNIEGIKFRLFPVKKGKTLYGRFKGVLYPQLTSLLNSEIKKKDTLVHLHGIHNPYMNSIYKKCNFSKIPVVGTQRGDISPFFDITRKPWKIFDYFIERSVFSNIDFFFAQSVSEVNYLSKKYGSEKLLHFQDGIDFSKIKPIEKDKARQKLGISPSAKILLYVGHFSSNKPAKTLVSAYEKIKEEGFDLYMLGGFDNHDLYDEIMNKIPNSKDRMNIDDLIYYYSAADIHVYPSNDPLFVKFSSISNANMESLACNVPIYTSQMNHFLGNSNEKEKIGIDCGVCKDEKKLIDDLVRMYSNLDKYVDCRKIAKKYYDRNHNVSKIKDIYSLLNRKYKNGVVRGFL